MGTMFGVALQRAGHDVVFLGRETSNVGEAVWHDVEYVDLAGKRHPMRFAIAHEPSVVSNADLAIVLVKRPDTVDALTRVAPFLASQTPVVTLQNGLHAAGTIRGILGGDSCVIPGTTSQAATRTDSHSVIHTGTGPTFIGTEEVGKASTVNEIATLLSEAGISTSVSSSIDRDIWQKVAVNAAINGPTALSGAANGAIASDPALRSLALATACEASQVAAAEGIQLVNLEDVVIGTATATARNRSSMLQDLEAGRPTESDAIYGEIQRAARRSGIATPRIDALSSLIEARSRGSRSEESQLEHDS